ncbi:MAG: BamA/TamA family outer membrane protein [Muribaculaceae bacterium]|nr:BamA/TamA family outer membrane protein [Muribaculaceae bacterium]
MRFRFIHFIIIAALAATVLAACSTTRRIPEGEYLFTGNKKVNYVLPRDSAGKTEKLPEGLVEDISSTIAASPNNYIKMIDWRYPFPLGLWVYNNWDPDSKGLKRWIYNLLVEEPVLVSEVRPQVRTHMIDELLDNNGYFRGTASYELIHPKDPKMAAIRYTVTPGEPYPIDSIQLLPDTSRLNHLIDSLAMRDPYLSRPQRYCTDSLSIARTRITNSLRNRGYYFFSPEYIEYLADSTITPRHIALRMEVAGNAPAIATRSWTTGHVTMIARRRQGDGIPDTIATPRATLVQMQPSRFRRKLVQECVVFRPGRTFSVRSMDRTQTNLSRLGIFSSIEITARPDSAAYARGEAVLNVEVDCTFDSPLEASLEVNATSKSNSYIGPGLTAGITNRNIFGGGEQLSLQLTGAYEWQTGRGSTSLFNSYEVGLTGSLAFPRMLAPKFIPRSRFNLNWTRFQLNAELLNRPHYFKMAQFNASVNYDWRLRRYVSNTLTLFKLSYTKTMNTTAEFDSIMVANPAVAQSFRSQFIPQMAYTYTYDRQFGRDNTLNWTFSIQEAGNIFWAIYRACGNKGEKKLFGTPFSQFVKGSAQLVWGRRIVGDTWLVSRVAAGAAHAYGNASEVPYSEQFFVGGANSVRAFTVRSIGPGSYTPPAGTPADNFDRTGTFKFEANTELRFPLFGPLHGAVFLDAGNVWLLKNDPLRPGGTLRAGSFLRDLALGTGAGLRLDISILVVRADLGIGIHAPYDTGRRGYYNMTSFKNSLAFHLAIGYPF